MEAARLRSLAGEAQDPIRLVTGRLAMRCVEQMRRGDDLGMRRIGEAAQFIVQPRESGRRQKRRRQDQVRDLFRDRCQCRIDVVHDHHIGANPFVEDSVQGGAAPRVRLDGQDARGRVHVDHP